MAHPLFPAHLADITFVVGNDPATRRTFSAIRNFLRAESPVFDQMLSGQWADGRTNTPIELPDDDPDAFLLLLELLHHGRSPRDKTPTAKTIFVLARTADKYDFVRLVRHPLESWIWKALEEQPKCLTFEKLSFMGYKFGLEKIFLLGVKGLAEHAFPSGFGKMVGKVSRSQEVTTVDRRKRLREGERDHNIDYALLHDGAEAHIRAARELQLNNLNNAVQRFVSDKAIRGNECLVEEGTDASEICKAQVLGMLVTSMGHAQIPIALSPKAIDGGDEAKHRLAVETVRCRLLNGLVGASQPGHEQCLPIEMWRKCMDEALAEHDLIPGHIQQHFQCFKQ